MKSVSEKYAALNYGKMLQKLSKCLKYLLGSTQWEEHKVLEWFPKLKSSVTPVEGVNIQDIHQ
jgi:hypothetical protein